MNSSTPSRYRDPVAVTTPGKAQDQNNASVAEEHALDAISQEVSNSFISSI